MERGFGVFGYSRRWECWFIALFARGSVVAKRERRRWRGVVCVGMRWYALIGRRHVVALLLAGESVVGVYFYSCVLHTRKRKH